MKKILFLVAIVSMLVQPAWCATNDFSKYIKADFDKYENITTYTVKSFNLDTI